MSASGRRTARTAAASGATIEPAAALAIALHAVMLSSGFANRQPAAAEGFPEGWNLGGGNLTQAVPLAAARVLRPHVAPFFSLERHDAPAPQAFARGGRPMHLGSA